MTQTFTPALEITANPTKNTEEETTSLPEFAEPSPNTIKNILNYSKSLEIKRSELINHVEIVKS